MSPLTPLTIPSRFYTNLYQIHTISTDKILVFNPSTGTHGGYMDGVPGAIELPTEAGDALILSELCTHGSNARTRDANSGGPHGPLRLAIA
jgi:hypothetical protein